MMAIECCTRGLSAVQVVHASLHSTTMFVCMHTSTEQCSLSRCMSRCDAATALTLGVCICAWVYMMAIECYTRGLSAFQLVHASYHTMPCSCVCVLRTVQRSLSRCMLRCDASSALTLGVCMRAWVYMMAFEYDTRGSSAFQVVYP